MAADLTVAGEYRKSCVLSQNVFLIHLKNKQTKKPTTSAEIPVHSKSKYKRLPREQSTG